MFATTNQVAAVSPAELARLLAEADAAYRRCHTVLPWIWVAELKPMQLQGRAMRLAIEAQTQRGAAGWDSALRQLGSQGYSEGMAAVQAYGDGTTRCGGCGSSSLATLRLQEYRVLQVGRRLRGGDGCDASAGERCPVACWPAQPSTPELLVIASATLLPGCLACCSRECQVGHWPQHRAPCKNAQAASTKPEQER